MSRATFDRSATFTWSPRELEGPLLATGTVAGALDENFSSESTLEIWDPFPSKVSSSSPEDDFFQDQGPLVKGTVSAPSRFSRLAWGYVHEPDRPQGVLASGLESGELAIWDPLEVLNSDAEKALVWNNKQHTGAVRGLDFNKGQPHVLATGATNGEIWVWDLNTPQKPYSPGSRSRNLADITSLAWNHQVSHILASSSTSGYTVVWDLKGRREVCALNFASPQTNNPNGGWMGSQQTRAGISSVSWHPENATKLATASEDDMNPVVMLWDLRNPRAPEKVLSGHDKGILSMNWCAQDPDLLISCGKDSRSILWNPNTGTSVGELSRTTNWTFESSWCPRLPDLMAVGSFDGKIDVHSLQATRSQAELQAEAPSGADLFEQGNLNVQSFPAVSLTQAPKWTKRPAAAAFGFGGKLVSVNAQHGGTVKIHHVVTEPDVVERAVKLDLACDAQTLADFAKERASGADLPSSSTAESGKEDETWGLLKTLFNADSREELVTMLGFSKEDIQSKVKDAVKTLKNTGDDESGAGGVREPLVTFAEEPEQQSQSPEGAEADASTPAQVPSESGASTGAPESTKTLGEGTEITEPSLFGDDAPGQQQAAADFYSSIRSGRPAAIPDHLTAGERAQSSVAATMGSRTSSVASMEQLRTNTFKIYPSDELEADRLVTRAVILGDFDSAVTLCLALDRYADALLLAVRGGPDLLASTQKAYFRRHSSTTPYLRLFESVASDDLGDIVQNADLTDWQEIFVVLCTFARKDDFASYVESLGQRIEFAAAQTKNADAQEALRLRKNALLAYLAARRLEKVVSILVEEMAEEEAADAAPKSSGHAKALQSFIEKVAVFKAATGYTDADLTNPTSSQTVAAAGARAYKLGALYDRYLEYAELLASQGLSSLAVRYANQVPADYRTSEHDEATAHIRERLVAGQPSKVKAVPNQGRLGPQAAPGRGAGYAPPTMPSMGNPFNAYGSGSAQQPVAPIPAGPPPAQNNPYGPARTMTPGASLERPPMPPPQPQTSTPNLYAPPAATGNAYTSAMAAQPYGAPTNNYYGPPPTNTYTAPPPPAAGAPPPPPPPASSAARKPDQGWNDAPSVVPPPPKRAPSAGPPRQQITSPFPMAQSPAMPPSSSNGPYGVAPPMASSSLPPPPPRGSTISPAHNYRSPMPPGPPPPPPQAGPYAPAAMPPASSPYAPLPPGDNMPPPPHAAPSPYLPAAQPAQPPSFQAPPGGIAGPPQPMPPKPATPLKPEPPQPKYPAGDRSHIPAENRVIFDVLSARLQLIRDNTPPTQKKMVDDTERRLNVLFDALNCETLSDGTVATLHEIIQAIEGHDPALALELHLNLLTSGPSSENLTAWMPAVKVIARTA